MLRMEIALFLVLAFTAVFYYSAGRRHTPLHRTFSLLLSTSLPIGEISEKSGYGDYRVFTKVFKKSEGITPSQFRREFLEEPESVGQKR